MTIEDRLRDAITHRTDRVEPAPDSLTRITDALDAPGAGTGRGATPTRRRHLVVLGAAAAALVLVAAAVLAVTGRDPAERVVTEPPASSTGTGPASTAAPTSTGPTGSTAPATTTTGGASTTGPPATTVPPSTTTPAGPALVDAGEVVWPRPQDEGLRFDDPVEAARSFAVRFAGFTDPQVGAFRAGDARSGEVPVRAAISTDSPSAVTTVLVRQMADDHWWVIGSTNPDLVPDQPSAGSTLVCDGTPVRLTGTALAFEGHVNVRITGFDAAGSPRTIGEGVVMGAGTPPAQPFEGGVACELAGATRDGVLSYLTLSARDGSVWQYVAVPVRFVVG